MTLLMFVELEWNDEPIRIKFLMLIRNFPSDALDLNRWASLECAKNIYSNFVSIMVNK